MEVTLADVRNRTIEASADDRPHEIGARSALTGTGRE
jgi:hypothetical protein